MSIENTDTKKAVLSAFYLLLQDRLKHNDKPDLASTAELWNRLDRLFVRHESQLDKLSVIAGKARSNISSLQFENTKNHAERMGKKSSKYTSLMNSLDKFVTLNNQTSISESEAKYNEFQRKNIQLSDEISDISDRLVALRARNEEASKKYNQSLRVLDDKLFVLQKRHDASKKVEERVEHELNELQQKLVIINRHHDELLEQLDLARTLANIVREPKDTIQRIYADT